MGIFLVVNAVLDFRKHEISLVSLAVFALAGAGLNLWLRYQAIWELLGGIGVGLLLIFTAFISREAIGFGDGLVVCVTGIYLGFWDNLRLLLTGLVLCALFVGLGLFIRRFRMTDRLPLVPFLLLAWLGRGFG
jgi:leader peptidase (prepilin peptidase)/N-methyltransferase